MRSQQQLPTSNNILNNAINGKFNSMVSTAQKGQTCKSPSTLMSSSTNRKMTNTLFTTGGLASKASHSHTSSVGNNQQNQKNSNSQLQQQQQSIVFKRSTSPYVSSAAVACRRQLQPSAKFDSNSKARENNNDCQTKNSAATGGSIVSSQLPTLPIHEKCLSQSILSKVTGGQKQNKKSKNSGLSISSSITASKAATLKRQLFATKERNSAADIAEQPNSHTRSNNEMPISLQSYGEAIMSPDQLKFDLQGSIIDDCKLREGPNSAAGVPFKERGQPKVLDQPQMPLDFVPSQSTHSMGIAVLEQEIIEKLPAKAASTEEIFSVGSIHNYMKSCGQSTESRDAKQTKAILHPFHQKSTPTQNYYLQSNKSIDLVQKLTAAEESKKYMKSGSDATFSFAGNLIKNSAVKPNERAPSHDELMVARVETLSSYNVRQDSPDKLFHQCPFPSKGKIPLNQTSVSYKPSVGNKILDFDQKTKQGNFDKKDLLQRNRSRQLSEENLKEQKGKPLQTCNLMKGKRPNQSKTARQSEIRPNFGAIPIVNMRLEEDSLLCSSESILSTCPADFNQLVTLQGEQFQRIIKSEMVKKESKQSNTIAHFESVSVFGMNNVKIDSNMKPELQRHISQSDPQNFAIEKALKKLGVKSDPEVAIIKKTKFNGQAQAQNQKRKIIQNNDVMIVDHVVLTEGRVSSARTSPCRNHQVKSPLGNNDLTDKLTLVLKDANSPSPAKVRQVPQQAVIRSYNNDIKLLSQRGSPSLASQQQQQHYQRKAQRRASGKNKLTMKIDEGSASSSKKVLEFKKQTPNIGQQFEPLTENETVRNSISFKDIVDQKIVGRNIDNNSNEELFIDDVADQEEGFERCLLSKSLEPKAYRSELLVKNKREMSQIRTNEVAAAYQDDYDSSHSSLKNMSQTANNFRNPNLINVLNVIPAVNEPSNFSQKGGSKSLHNYSVGPNDDSISQVSCDRQRRAQYHRLLSLGKVDEVERQVSMEIQSNNQDAVSLYTRAKLAEKQKNYAQAIDDFGKVLELDPSFFNAAYAKASCENIIGRYDDAIVTYNLAFTKDIDAPVFTQTNNSRLTSKRGSPKHIRMSRQGSRLFGQSQSPFRVRSIEPLISPSDPPQINNFANQAEVIEPSSLLSMHKKNRRRYNMTGQAPITMSSNIIEVDSENSEKTPSLVNECRKVTMNHTKNNSSFYEAEYPAQVSISLTQNEREIAQDVATPNFDNLNGFSTKNNGRFTHTKQTKPLDPEIIIDVTGDESMIVDMDEKKSQTQNIPGLKPASMRQIMRIDQSSPSKFHLKKTSMQSSTLSKGNKKSLAFNKGKQIKKGLKRKLKVPQPWPATALPSQKRTSAATKNGYIPYNSFGQYEKFMTGKNTENTKNSQKSQNLSGSNNALQMKLNKLSHEQVAAQLTQGIHHQEGNNVTVIGQVNIQMSSPSQVTMKQDPSVVYKHANQNFQMAAEFAEKQSTQLSKSNNGDVKRGDKKDQKDRQISKSNSMQTSDKLRSYKQDEHDISKSSQQRDIKGVPSEEGSFNQYRKLYLGDENPSENYSRVVMSNSKAGGNFDNKELHTLDQYVISESNLLRASPPLGMASVDELKISAIHSSAQDLTLTYNVLSKQLLRINKGDQRVQISKLKYSGSSRTGQEQTSSNSPDISNTTIEQQPEWFLLAKSSYKMKKYGECLFAVSKAAGAISRKQKQQNSTSHLKNQFSAVLQTPQKPSDDSRILLIEHFQNSISPETEPGELNKNSSTCTFDADGNLNRLGQVQLGYIKAKCLQKLKRYSESLFQLARVEQLTNANNVLPEGQQSKMLLYKGICLFHTKQYKSAAQVLNLMLAKISSKHNDLMDNMRESYFKNKKNFAGVLIQAYIWRAKASEMLQDYEGASQDYNKLIELSQFQDLPTEKVFEYMTARTALKAKMSEASITKNNEKNNDFQPTIESSVLMLNPVGKN